jgi:hypothetical protein
MNGHIREECAVTWQKNRVEVLYFDVNPLLWQDCLAAQLVLVQIITGLPPWTKAEHSGPGAVTVMCLLLLGPFN